VHRERRRSQQSLAARDGEARPRPACHPVQPVRRGDHVLLRYAEVVATALDKDKLHDVLDQAVIVIDERDLERSRNDPRVRVFHESSARLMAELEAEGANYD
jgi:hypothetical protein